MCVIRLYICLRTHSLGYGGWRPSLHTTFRDQNDLSRTRQGLISEMQVLRQLFLLGVKRISKRLATVVPDTTGECSYHIYPQVTACSLPAHLFITVVPPFWNYTWQQRARFRGRRPTLPGI